MLARRPKSSRLLSRRGSRDDSDVVQSSTTSLQKSNKILNFVTSAFFNFDHTRDQPRLLIECLNRLRNGKYVNMYFAGVGKGRSGSQREEKLPSLAQVNREITELSSELVGRRAMEPGELVDWISDKRGGWSPSD